MGKLSRTWGMMRASWWVLKQDKELLLFPVLSTIAAVLVVVSFALPLFGLGLMSNLDQGGEGNPLIYVIAFAFYFVNYFVIIFFNSAIVACAIQRMEGGNPTVGSGLSAAWQRLPQILGWALVTSTVGFILRMIEERVGFVGQIIVAVLGMAWTVTSFLVVPVLVVEGKGALQAYKDSVGMLKRTWGEQLMGNIGFGLVFMLLGLPAAVVVVLSFASGSPTAVMVAVGLSALYLVSLGVVQSTLQAIYQAAVYRYAVDGRAPAGFDEQLMAESFRHK